MPTLATSTFQANLDALRLRSPAAAELIAAAPMRDDIQFIPASAPAAAGSGPGSAGGGGLGGGGATVWSALMTDWTPAGPVERALASRRDPLAEAARLADTVDIREAALVAVAGFGLGYHVAELARRMRGTGVIIIYEPDVSLLRSALERIDFTDAFARAMLIVISDPDDEGAMARAFQGCESLLAMGLAVVEHPASKPRLGEGAGRFLQRLTRVMQAARTAVVTTMVQTEATLRNLTQNLDLYATAPGVGELRDQALGRPGIVVSAGPSLARALDLLTTPGLADRCVIIAVQTALKPLLARGIRPHFVTALDFHEISRRFYEGLTPEHVRGVQLVVEPKVNPAVPEAFPGVVRCCRDAVLDQLLGPDLRRPLGALTPGATVAHLAYYLARHLGCDPVLLVGQDLAFTDGQYYAAGAVIHDVWAAELNPFRSLEMLEWERIVRARSTLRQAPGHDGKSVYLDEQMATYLVQFQRDFRADHERGLRVIDATGGGVAKAYAPPMPLRDALEELGILGPDGLPGPAETPDPVPLAQRLAPPEAMSGPERRRRVRAVIEHLRGLRRDVGEIARHSRDAAALLAEMGAHHDDQPRVNALITRLDELRERVHTLQPAFGLVQTLNQTGGLNRHRADRQIALAEHQPLARQKAQIDRDLTNVTWLADAAEQLARMLEDAVRTLAGGPRLTRDPAPRPDAAAATDPSAPAPAPDAGAGAASAGPSVTLPGAAARVMALIPVDEASDGLGRPRDLARPVYAGLNALQLTLRRLARCTGLDGAVILARDVERARALLAPGGVPAGPGLDWPARFALRFLTVTDEHPGWDPRAIRGARAFAPDAWRGGLGNLSVYDEALWPAPMLRALRDNDLPAGLLVAPDWAFIDPALCDQIIERYREDPATRRFTFSQAAPGLAGCVVDRRLLEQIAQRRAAAGAFASIGGILGYVPTAPAADMIAKPLCVAVPAAVRDAPRRASAEQEADARAVLDALSSRGLDPLTCDAARLAAALAAPAAPAAAAATSPAGPLPLRHLVLEVIDARGAAMTPDAALALLQPRGDGPRARGLITPGLTAVTLQGRDPGAGPGADPLEHPACFAFIQAARRAGAAALHVRTPLRAAAITIERLLEAQVEVVSVDLFADDEPTYRQLTGRGDFDAVRAGLARLLAGRHAGGPHAAPAGVPVPWVVPRLTRRQAVLDQIERFYDTWLLTAGAAVIDPLPSPRAGERLEPLPLPALAALRRARGELTITPDGSARPSLADLPASLAGEGPCALPHAEAARRRASEPLA